MREIKFRAWNSIDKVYVDWSTMMQTAFNRGEMHLLYTMFHNRHYELEQLTGLKDKNGADIYCGDLLAWPENSAYVFKVEFKLGCYVARCYHKGELSGVDYLNPTLIKRKNAKCPLEVIGNIHQHRELLEK